MRRGTADLLTVAPLTAAIIAINFVLYFISVVQSGGNMMRIDPDVLLALGASMRERLWEGDWLRLIAPNFLHGGLLHIFLNTMFLYQIGPMAEVYFGTANFGTLYLLSGIGGFCFSQIFGGSSFSVGASCSLFGMLGAVLAVKILQAPVPRNAWKNEEVRQIAWVIAVNLAIGLSGMLNIDNWGHLGGLVIGLLLAFAFELWRRRHAAGVVSLVAVLLLVAGLVCAARWSIFNPYYELHQGVVAAEEKKPDAEVDAHFKEAIAIARIRGNEQTVKRLIANFRLGNWSGDQARRVGYKFIARYYQARLAPPVQAAPASVPPPTTNEP